MNNKSASAQFGGNNVSLQVDGVDPIGTYKAPLIKFTMSIDDGVVPDEVMAEYQEVLTTTFGNNDLVEPNPRDYDTRVIYQMGTNEALEFANRIINEVARVNDTHTKLMNTLFNLKSAQIGCIRGEIGKITVKKVSETTRANAFGFAIYDIMYYGDIETDAVLYSVEGLESFIPPDQEGQYEWFRSIMGGNHNYTTDIAISLDGFSLEDITKNFNDHLSSFLKRAKVTEE